MLSKSRLVCEGVFSPHVDEILPGLVGRPKIGHLSFVYDAHLVKELEKRLSGLVEGTLKSLYVPADRLAGLELKAMEWSLLSLH